MTGSGPTLDQRRAKHAWEAVQRARSRTGAHGRQDFDKFATEVKKLPMRIMASGLGPVLAFLEKQEVPGLLAELSDWVVGKRGIGPGGAGSLLQAVIDGNSDLLRRATDETLTYLQWLKRFVDAEEGQAEKQAEARAGDRLEGRARG